MHVGGQSHQYQNEEDDMPSIEKTIEIEVPYEEVYEFVANDVERLTEFVPIVKEVFDVSPGPIGEGTTFKERMEMGPMKRISSWRVAELDPPKKVLWVGHQSDMEMTLTKHVQPSTTGTIYSQVFDYRMYPSFRLLGWLLEKLIVHRQMSDTLDEVVVRIKEIVEDEHAARGQQAKKS